MDGQAAVPEKCDHAWASSHQPGHLLYWVRQCMICHEMDWDDLDAEIGKLTTRAGDNPMTEAPMRQSAPYPRELADLVTKLAYKADWRCWLEDRDRGQGSTGLTLVIQRYGPDSYHPHRALPVNHYMIVPAANYNRRSWQRWLFDQFLLVEQHEAAEFFVIDGHRPYAPIHAPGNDPYLVAELASDEERRTSFRGDLNPGRP